MARFYVETGAAVSATGAAVPVYCVIDSLDDHEQIGPGSGTRDEAEEWAEALNGKVA